MLLSLYITGTVKTLYRDTSMETEFGKAVYGSPTRSELAAVSSEMCLEIMEVGEGGKKVLCFCYHVTPHHTWYTLCVRTDLQNDYST